MAGEPAETASGLASIIGRGAELNVIERTLSGGEAAPAVLFVHGPGGIGKTALIRRLLALATASGRPVRRVDGRELPPAEGILADRIGVGHLPADVVIALDSFELVEGTSGWIAEQLVPVLEPGTVLALGSRNPPSRELIGLPGLTEIRLGPLEPPEARRLAVLSGADDARTEQIVDWAAGHPLAIELAGRLAAARPGWSPEGPDAPEELIRAIVRRFGEVDVATGHLTTLSVAAIARSTTPALLAAALPDHDANGEWDWLSERSFTEPVGHGLALHSLLADAVRAELQGRDPLLARELKRRIADFAYETAEDTGELERVLELSHLIENPGLRWGFVWEASAHFYPDAPRPDDAEAIDRAFADPEREPVGGSEVLWTLTRSLFERMPELGVVVRDRTGAVRGFTFVPTTSFDDAELEMSPLLGPCLRHARRLEPRGEALVMPYMCDLTGDPGSGIIGMLANAAVLRSSRANPRYAYMTINPEVEMARMFAQAAGAERRPELDLEVGEPMEAWLLDFGPGGFLAHQRELVYSELGLEPPPRPREGARSVRGEEVRDALRALRKPEELAASPLADGDGTRERAESVRAKLLAAIEAEFSDDEADQELKEVIVSGYLDGDESHGATAQKLYLSRATYFRRLRRAVDRIVDRLSDPPAPG